MARVPEENRLENGVQEGKERLRPKSFRPNTFEHCHP